LGPPLVETLIVDAGLFAMAEKSFSSFHAADIPKFAGHRQPTIG
jgi:hypothetical protein